ncbi:MAG: hypothetical protein GX089_09710 [Fibrobacter sp.]|jgi:hypothetical protein|nr:hypothetical protein [Fibrobacter sp.]
MTITLLPYSETTIRQHDNTTYEGALGLPWKSGIQLSFLLPPVKIKKPALLTRLVTFSRRAQHYVNIEGVTEDRSLLRAEGRGRLPAY